MTACLVDWIGDNFCDDENNNIECNFDGGDCCNNDYENWDIYCQICECHELRLVYCFTNTDRSNENGTLT